MSDLLQGVKLLVSVGPMRTSVDTVRFIQNRSSGQMGLALVKAAVSQGAEVEVLLGPVDEAIADGFEGLRTQRYVTVQDYGHLLESSFPECDVFLSLAAVLDFEVVPAPTKIVREDLKKELLLGIRPVRDFAAWAGHHKRSNQKVIAFAAEEGTPEDILSRAERKRENKKADAIVANPVRADLGPDSVNNELWVLRPGRTTVHLGPGPKAALAPLLIEALFS